MIATKLIPPLSQSDKDRFWRHVDKTSSPCGCWLWTGVPEKNGYCRFWLCNQNHSSHRVSFVLSGGEFKEGGYVLHNCQNRHCVNPAHLYSGTPKQNQDDRKRDGTLCDGQSCHLAKLTESLVIKMRVMRAERGSSYEELGLLFGVSPDTAANTCKWRTWKNIA